MTTQAIQLPFGPWTPDLPTDATLLDARNVVARVQSYRSMRSLVPATAALANPAKGFASYEQSDGTYRTFAGDGTRLYGLGIGTKVGGGAAGNLEWGDLSIAGGYTAVTRWEFVRFRDRVLALSDKNDVPQSFVMGTSTAFDDLGGSPPRAKTGAVVGDYLMLGDLNDGVDPLPFRVQWCGWNQPTVWTAFDVGNRAGYVEFTADGGLVRRIVGGQTRGVIFRDNSVVLAELVGGAAVFRFTDVLQSSGLRSAGALATLGADVYYLGSDGFRRINIQAGASERIGVNRVDDWFFENANAGRIENMRAVADPNERVVYFAFATSDAPTNINDRLLIYAIDADRWSYAELDTQEIGMYWNVNINGFTFTDIDQTEALIDDPTFRPGDRFQFGGFLENNDLGPFSGSALDACLVSPEITGTPDEARMFVNRVRPRVEAAQGFSATVQLETRDDLGATPVKRSAIALNRLGEAPVRSKARYTRFRVQTTGAFDHFRGLTIYIRKPSQGRR